ncbi:hypothetical protein F5X99DRAFT_151381 [Biscogniauxia marginata]|nr:hypothetical protein F5X99DRAFT_151381 [Biscogniauxia marginata]
MPRPKRSRAAKTTSPVAVPAPVPKPSEPGSNPSSDIYDVSDREKEKAKERRRSLRVVATSTRMRSASTSGNPQQAAKELNKARQRRDSAMERLENMTSTTDNAADDSNDKSDRSVEIGRRDTATPLQERLADLSGLDLDDSMFDDINTTFETAGPVSAHRSADTSTLSATHFKRRPRAGSFLSRDDGPIRPSSRTGPNTPSLSSTFNIGVFRRRAREPSILGTAQKPRPQRPEPEPDTEIEQAEEQDEAADEDDFAPEDESTPLRRASQRRSEAAAATAASPSTNPRKRKSTESHEQRVRSSPYGVRDSIEDAVEQEDSDLSSPQPSLPPLLDNRPSTPVMDEGLMAPPLSSGSSEGDPEVWPPLQSLAKGRRRRSPPVLRRTPVPSDNISDMSSPPSLTYSPNYAESSPPPTRAAKAKRKAASKPEPKVTTADLAGMLPRRRRGNTRTDDPFGPEDSDAEVDASGLGNDDDELSYLDVRARRARSARNRSAASRGRSGNRNNNKGKQTPGPSSSTTKNKDRSSAARTYGRSSDKENQQHDDDDDDAGEVEGEEEEEGDGVPGDGDEEEGSEQMLSRMGDELKNAARKFQEVDKWELEYEEMTQSSSPRDAR